VTVEGGAGGDSNVERMETTPGNPTKRIAAPVGRAGARIAHKDRLLGGGYVLGLSALARMVASSAAKDENVMLYAGDARWLRALDTQPVAIGAGVTAADAFGMTGQTGARTFRNLGGDALLALGSGEQRRLMLAVGGRDFLYKPNHAFNWHGPVVNARFDAVLWQTAGKTKTLELATTFGFEARAYAGVALRDVCPPGSPLNSECSIETKLTRRDRYQRAGAELNWTGEIVFTVGYQFTAADSNSYGQSLVRHRVLGSATAELLDKLFGTLTATLQIDQYPDGVLVERYVQRQELTSLEDENRSSLQVRIARELSSSWTLEARGAIWRDFGHSDVAAFYRQLIYTGVTYSR
jgi:hypothetical protein